MKIIDIKPFVVDCFRTNWVFVKVYTDEGVEGVGEATLEYKEKALVGAIEHAKEALVGKDPMRIEEHVHNLYRDAYWRGGAVLMSAISGIEMALWDIKGKALGVVCDVRDYQQVCAARDLAVAKFGSIDVMVNFAGGNSMRIHKIPKEVEFPDIPIEVFDWGLDVNLRAQLYFAHAVMKQMREQKSGLIINIGSITGAEGDGYGVDYPTSKAGLMFGLTKSQAQYGAKYGIRSVCVSPGPVLTRPGMAKMRTLLGRAADPQEIIDLILFIASDKGQFINGENIMIDGGRNAMTRG